MNTMVKQFEVMDEVMLSNIEGGVSCFEGIVGIGGLGAVAGPWGSTWRSVSRSCKFLHVIIFS